MACYQADHRVAEAEARSGADCRYDPLAYRILHGALFPHFHFFFELLMAVATMTHIALADLAIARHQTIPNCLLYCRLQIHVERSVLLFIVRVAVLFEGHLRVFLGW